MNHSDLALAQLRDIAEAAATVAAAAEAGLFHALHEGPLSAEELATRSGLDARAVSIILPVLAELGLVEPEAGAATTSASRYRLTERAGRELGDPRSPDYQGRGLPLWLENLRSWTRLAESLRTGAPVEPVDDEAGDDEAGDDARRRDRIARFMAGMAAAPGERVERLVDAVLGRRPGARTILDVGGGPGHIARAFIDQGLDAVLLDRPEVEEFIRHEYGLAQVPGLRTVGADFLADPLPAGPFDVVLLSNILHMLSPAQSVALLRQARSAMVPGGVVAIADFLRGRSPRAARFAVVMLLRTSGGNTYTLDDHQKWLELTGFHKVILTDLDPERQLITALTPP